MNRAGKRVLERFVTIFKDYSSFRLLVEGHTHSRGRGNQKLSATKKQAERITETLRDAIPRVIVSSLGRGDDAPVSSNRNARGRKENERIDIVIFK